MEVKVVSQEMALLSNILAAYTFIAGTVGPIERKKKEAFMWDWYDEQILCANFFNLAHNIST